ncbi:MAG: SUMF1/EgtB/PvdO family nonheme iron enzyme, partial [Bacteroidota bacterium]
VWEADLEYSGNQKNMLWYRDFDNYPVTGVSPAQAMAYCRWKTEKMQKIYFEDYFDEEDEEQEVNRKNSSEAVDNEQSESESDQLKDEKHEHDEHGGLSDRKMRKRATKLGFPMPEYRLPTEAELMHAAVGRTVDNEDNLEVEARVYPWGNSLRDEHGEFIPRIKRGPGNYGGATGESDSHGGPYEVDDGYFNDFGLRIGDNVRAISGDIYRDASFEDVSDLNPMRKDGALDPAKDYDAQPYSVDEYYVVKFASFMTGPREVTHREKAHVLHGARRDLGFWIAMTPVGPGMRRER